MNILNILVFCPLMRLCGYIRSTTMLLQAPSSTHWYAIGLIHLPSSDAAVRRSWPLPFSMLWCARSLPQAARQDTRHAHAAAQESSRLPWQQTWHRSVGVIEHTGGWAHWRQWRDHNKVNHSVVNHCPTPRLINSLRPSTTLDAHHTHTHTN